MLERNLHREDRTSPLERCRLSNMQPDLKDRATRLIYFTLNLMEEIQASPGDIDAKECRDNLMGLLDAIPSADAPAETNRRVQYALTVWVDELVSRAPWPYARSWDAHPLELVIFGTNGRRWRFFEQAETARNCRDWDALLVFQFCIQFGFRGIYARQRAKVPANGRLPILRARRHPALATPISAAVLQTERADEAASNAEAVSENIPESESDSRFDGARPRRPFGPLLPATLAEWCQKTFQPLDRRRVGLPGMALPRSWSSRVLPVQRVFSEWAIVMAIGVFLSAVLFAIGY